MKENKRTVIALLAILTLFACLVTVLVGCGGEKITKIAVSETEPPRVRFVQGEEIDLSDGMLTVTKGGKEISVSLGDSAVGISGYDKNLLGKQTVRVEYKGKTATLDITVIPRITAEGFESVYFLGEDLDLSLGTLIIANDNATTFSVPFSDSRVSFEGFSTSSLGAKTVTVKYSDGASKEYSTNFTVTVYTNDKFEMLSDINASLSAIPTDWTPAALSNYKTQIDQAVNLMFILRENEACDNLRDTLKLLDAWRDKKDTFEIIYSYYCYTAADGHSFVKNNLWQVIPLPKQLEQWYSSVEKATKEAVFMATNKDNSAYLYDTTDFMIYYFEALAKADLIKNGTNGIDKDIYSIINGDLIIENNLRRAYGGYITHTDAMLGVSDYEALWDKYISLVQKTNETASGDNGTEELFEAFSNLTPAQIHGFLSSLNFLYGKSDGSVLVSDTSEKNYNGFFKLLYAYYEKILPQSVNFSFKKLVIAMESYSLSCVLEDKEALSEKFKSSIESAKATYLSLNDTDKELFDTLFGKTYEKYISIYDAACGDLNPDLPNIKNKTDELNSTLIRYFDLLDFITDESVSTEEKDSAFALLFSLYERANGIFKELLAEENTIAYTALSALPCEIFEKTVTLDTAFYLCRSVFVSYMVSTVIDNGSDGDIKEILWDGYSASDIGAFLKEASYILEYKFYGTPLYKSTVDAVCASFRELGEKEQKIFYMMKGYVLYYDGLEKFFHASFPLDNKAKEFSTALLEAEYAYTRYKHNQTSADLRGDFSSKMETAVNLYGKFANQTARDQYFKVMYDFYLEIYNTQ